MFQFLDVAPPPPFIDSKEPNTLVWIIVVLIALVICFYFLHSYRRRISNNKEK